jgi:hypothetical protein
MLREVAEIARLISLGFGWLQQQSVQCNRSVV